MKTLRKIQKVAIAVGLIYGFWLGCNVDATERDNTSAFIMVALAAVIGISMNIPNKKQEKSL
ncbi:hypothetical protein [Bacteroides clarus]|uniref:hypothetical protein n=1 Tax=Bacteroides clarus TaxID=626929 RepID=UPI0026665275|nr:hypothetical protein [Bacteroides clarus]